jgi:SAM-dependent methyltransferase
VDPLAGTPWSAPGTVEGFVRSPPNEVLVRFARDCGPPGRAIDLGCGAARNAVPLAQLTWDVVGTDLSWPMLVAARNRASQEQVSARVHVLMAPMDRLPFRDHTFELIVAHGIWNLARSASEFRAAVREAARVARPNAALFVFTFSRNTLAPDALPVAGEPFVFTQFSGQPQCFLTDAQLLAELGDAGFIPDPRVPLREHNRRPPGAVSTGAPVIYEAAFRLDG